MRKRKRVNPTVTHVMADGRALTHTEFMAKPYIVVAEDNFDFHITCNRVFDPNYYQKEHLRRKFMLAEKRRAELEAQQSAIVEQLEQMRQ